MSGKNDPDNYRKISEPFESSEKANESLAKFYDAVELARNENHIADVHVLAKINVMRGEVEGEGMTSVHFGNSLQGALMCAWGLGKEQQYQEDAIRQYLKGV